MKIIKYDDDYFIGQVKDSFKRYLCSGSSRSTDKLKPLHKAFAEAISESLSDENNITIKSQGYGEDKEGIIKGKYSDKHVDITVYSDNKPIAGFAIKFVMRNYSQNVVNYFDNMLGETVNIRSNNIPYFQVLILFDKIPYFKSGNNIDHWEDFTNNKKDKFSKYETLSKDDSSCLYHTPDKMLLVLLHLNDNERIVPDENGKQKTQSDMDSICTFNDYKKYYTDILDNKETLCYSTKIDGDKFKDTIIVNDFETFIKKSSYIIKGKMR